MFNSPEQISIDFLQSSLQARQQTLLTLGIARYDFLLKMRFHPANIACVAKFLNYPNRSKFPDLTGADLSELNLDGVNLIRGNLTNTNLQKSTLINADLLFVNFSHADLRDANLTGATLNETIWNGTLVDGCQFGTGKGLTDSQRQQLYQSGAQLVW